MASYRLPNVGTWLLMASVGQGRRLTAFMAVWGAAMAVVAPAGLAGAALHALAGNVEVAALRFVYTLMAAVHAAVVAGLLDTAARRGVLMSMLQLGEGPLLVTEDLLNAPVRLHHLSTDTVVKVAERLGYTASLVDGDRWVERRWFRLASVQFNRTRCVDRRTFLLTPPEPSPVSADWPPWPHPFDDG